MNFRSLGDTQAVFEFVKDVDELPGNLTLSATMVLIGPS